MKEKYAVTYIYHEDFVGSEIGEMNVKTTVVEAECIGEAINEIDKYCSKLMEVYHWSDYNITNVNIIKELY